MLRLQTFGGLWLEGASADSPIDSGPRRRLALLAILAAAGARGVSRDRLLLLLWPDSTEANARHALSQLLYMLRRDAGSEIATGATELRLDATLIGSDLAEFDAALTNDQPERAAGLYRGPFLDGFYLENGEEFERWAAEMRGAISRRARGALEQAVRRAAERGDRADAAEFARRLTQLEPLSAPYALAYMEALAEAGDRGTALKFAKEYEAVVRRELKTPTEPSIRALAQRLAAQLQHSSATEPPPPAPPEPNVPADEVPAAANAEPVPAPPKRWRGGLAWLVAGAVVATVGFFALRSRRGPALDAIKRLTVEAFAGVTLPLVRPSYTPDGAAAALTDGTSNAEGYLATFPYLQHPNEGYEHSHD